MKVPFTTAIAGIARRQDIATQVREGDWLQVRHDPSNPVDADAFAVTTAAGDLVGYLPAAVAERVAGAFGHNQPFEGEVTSKVGGYGDKHVGLRIKLRPVSADSSTDDTQQDDAAAAMIPEAGGQVQVQTRTGRLLGTFQARDGDVIVVDTDAGPVRYPARLVELTQTPGPDAVAA